MQASRPKPPRKPAAATPMAFVRAILLGYRRYGADPGEALRQARIAPADVKRTDATITALQMEALCFHAMQELDDEALGWFTRRMHWGSYGMLCRASITAPDLGVALKRWCRHHALLVDDITLSLDIGGSAASLAITEHRELGALREFCLVTCLRYVHGFVCWLADSQLPLIEASFPFAAPPHASVYPLLFPGRIVFGAARAGFSFDAQYLALPSRRDEKALRTMLRRALPLTVLQYRRDRLLAQRVRDLLRREAGRFANAERVASALQVSVRSLHRQLQVEGTSLQALKDESRREQAIDLLRRSARSIKQVSAAVGFANEKSFSRAFKAWTGQSPSDFRRGT